jgi:hypothetical protein
MRKLRQVYTKQLLIAFLVALATGIVVFGLPAESQAQVTISGVTATVTGGGQGQPFAHWSDQPLIAGQTLVLAQNSSYNFDISDVKCAGACPAAVISGTIGGQAFSFTDTNQVLTLKNLDPSPTVPDANNFNEAQDYVVIGSKTVGSIKVTVSVAYADNVHLNACGTGATSVGLVGNSNCLPSPFDGATFKQFAGAANPLAASGLPNHCASGTINDNCFDSGVILFTATAVTTNACPLTQGFWKNHFPGSWPASVISGGLTIGTNTYTAAQLEANLQRNPSGGNALVILSHQLITALIDIANGSDSTPIAATITAAQAAIGGLDINTQFVAAGSSLGQQMTALADTLDSYNNSALTPSCTGPK